MIRFACPRCKTVLERPDAETGSKLSCPGCQQRLQVPLPPENKTILGSLMTPALGPAFTQPVETSPATPVIGDVRVRVIDNREHVLWHCPLCQNEVKVALDLGQTTVRCPHCAKRIDVPSGARTAASPAVGIQSKAMPVAPAALPPPVPAGPRPVSTLPVARDDWDSRDEEETRRPRRRDRYDDDESLIERRSRSGYAEEDCIRGANVGFLCSLISLGLVFAAMIIWLVLIAEQPRPRDANPFVFIILAIGLASFVMGLIGTIFSSRGLDQVNTRNRGLAITGLICGILGMVIGLIGSAVFFCIGMFFLALPWR